MAKISPPNPPKTVFCLVEIPKGGSNKYEYDYELNCLVLDRVLYGSIFYPTEYGHIPNTICGDGDAIDIMVVTTFPTLPGSLIKSRPIGALEIIDSGQQDTKIIAVATCDPRVSHFRSLKDLSPHFKSEIENFWERYAELQPNKNIKIDGWHGRRYAQKQISLAIKKWQKSVE